MKRKCLSIFPLLLIAIFMFSGCIEEPKDVNDSLNSVNVISGNETIIPEILFLNSSSWGENGWVATDALPLTITLPNIANELPLAVYNDDFSIIHDDNISIEHLSIFNDKYERIHHNVDITYLQELANGDYYVSVIISIQGKYVKSEKKHEYHGYNYIFKLEVS